MPMIHSFSVLLKRQFSTRTPDVFKRVVNIFPKDMQMVFAYGSGVFQQSGSDMSRNMLDFIFVVNDPHTWHLENVQKNPKHYSTFFRRFPSSIAPFQEKFGAGVYFNTLIPFEERLIKYGVISSQCLISDLKHWDSLYISGRLHKPVNIVVPPTCIDLSLALRLNLESALHVSLLLLPAEFTEEQLYIKIASLSYSGDFRMVVGEDKGKVRKLVEPNLLHFRELYDNFIKNESHIYKKQSNYEQSKCDKSILHHLKALPTNVSDNLCRFYKRDLNDQALFLDSITKEKDLQKYVAQSVAQIVKGSSIWQSLKGIPTAGFAKTVTYSGSKLKKMVKGMLPKATST